jgi:hypothetical protein
MKTSAIKYLVGIVLCEIVLLLSWINIAPDADVSEYESVKAVLESSQTTQQPEFQLASSAIHHSSQYLHIMSVVIVSTSLIVIILSFLIGWQMLKNRDKKS